MADKNNKSNSDDLRTWLGGMAFGALLLAVVIAAYSFGFNRGNDSAVADNPKAASVVAKTAEKAPADVGAADGAKAPTRAPSTADTAAGKKLFLASSCSGCHTLADAGAKGTAGPNLDMIKPSTALVLSAIKDGGTGSGAMPKGLYAGKDAQEVADYVSAVAGK
jgi:mono/diheme cytochrome c family protein